MSQSDVQILMLNIPLNFTSLLREFLLARTTDFHTEKKNNSKTVISFLFFRLYYTFLAVLWIFLHWSLLKIVSDTVLEIFI